MKRNNNNLVVYTNVGTLNMLGLNSMLTIFYAFLLQLVLVFFPLYYNLAIFS
jgi:hypothetical protein